MFTPPSGSHNHPGGLCAALAIIVSGQCPFAATLLAPRGTALITRLTGALRQIGGAEGGGGEGRRDQWSLREAPHTRTSKVAPLMLAFLGTIWNDYHRASVPVMENYGVIQAKRGEGELSRGRAGATDMEVGAGD